jgi:hypothetical protein
MKREDYKKGLIVKLVQPVRVRCCEVDPIPQDAQIVLFDQISPNRANVGLYFGPEAPYDAYHHTIWPIGKLEKKITEDHPLWNALKRAWIKLIGGNPLPKGAKKGTGKAGDIFPQGGFCLHKVKISGIQGEVVGEVKKQIFERAGNETAQKTASQES